MLKTDFDRQKGLTLMHRFYYLVKPCMSRRLQLALRRVVAKRKLQKVSDIWPVDQIAGSVPDQWKGWPGGKKFAFVLSHDVDTAYGLSNCSKLMDIDEELGFCSSFYIVPEKYEVSENLLIEIKRRGFGLGVHGLKHDGKLFFSKDRFSERAKKINYYIKKWGVRGFSSPSMHHNLKWMSELDIEFDTSTFDTDPFEPQSDSVSSIFPFIVDNKQGRKPFVELPYTVPQDFTLFCILQMKDISVWKKKVDWIAERGGMALVNVHPDYINFGSSTDKEKYDVEYYISFLKYIKNCYSEVYWNVCAEELAAFYGKI